MQGNRQLRFYAGVYLNPTPRGTGTVSASVPKKLLMMTDIDNCYNSTRGYSAILGNLDKVISKTYPQPLGKDHVHQVSSSVIH
jgi:hypothetical protein